MNPPSEDIKDYIEANTSHVFNADLFVSVEPDSPNETLTLYDYAGSDSDPKFNIEYSQIQFRSRAATYKRAYEIVSEIKVLLEGLRADQTLNGSRYFGFYVTSQPAFILRDKSKRFVFTMNMQIRRNPEDSGNRN